MKIIEPEVFNEELKDLRKYMQSKGYSPNEEILFSLYINLSFLKLFPL